MPEPKKFAVATLKEHKAPIFSKMKIVENTTGRKGILCTVEVDTLQRADVKNGNKRVYPRSVWERTLNRPEVTERLRGRRMVGELDHPESGQTAYERVSHVMTEARLRSDGNVSGKLDVLDTPNGKILDALLRAEVTVGISSRGDGSTREGDDGETTVVEDDFILDTWDIVVNPSTPGAFLGLAESQERTNKMVAAFEALVKGTNDLSVLSESYKVINELIESDKGGQFKKVREHLDAKLKEMAGPQVPVEQPQRQETHMEAAQIAQEATRLATTMVEAARLELTKQHQTETARLHNTIREQADQLGVGRKREAAATGLIENFIFQNRKLREAATASPSPGGTDGKVAKLENELKACKGLLEAALKAIEKLKGNTMRAEAGEKLVASMLEHFRISRRKQHIENLVKGNPNAGRLRGILEGLPSLRRINEAYSAVREIAGSGGGGHVREPLPGGERSIVRQHHVINESVQGGHRPGVDSVVSQLTSRMGGAV
jgi:hypothetical protein